MVQRLNMAGNLVVIKDNVICFSRYFRKTNHLPNDISLLHMTDIVDARFCIPLKETGFHGLMHTKIDPNIKKNKEIKDVLSGPQMVTIHENTATEHCVNIELVSYPILTYDGSIYCRSDIMPLESAATAASFVYENVLTIYTEAIKACGLNLFPFYIGDIASITKGMEKLQTFENLAVKARDDKMLSEKTRTKIIDTTVNEFKSAVNNIEKFLGLILIDSK